MEFHSALFRRQEMEMVKEEGGESPTGEICKAIIQRLKAKRREKKGCLWELENNHPGQGDCISSSLSSPKTAKTESYDVFDLTRRKTGTA